jgi:hypothetical protein
MDKFKEICAPDMCKNMDVINKINDINLDTYMNFLDTHIYNHNMPSINLNLKIKINEKLNIFIEFMNNIKKII